MFCNNCGKKISYNNKKCKSCGEKIVFEDIGKGISFDEPVVRAEEPVMAEVMEAELAAGAKNPYNMRIIAGVVAAVFVFVAGILIYSTTNHDDDDGRQNAVDPIAKKKDDSKKTDDKKKTQDEKASETKLFDADGYTIVRVEDKKKTELKIKDEDNNEIVIKDKDLLKKIEEKESIPNINKNIVASKYEFGYLGKGIFVVTRGAYIGEKKEVGVVHKRYSKCFLINAENGETEEINAVYLSIIEEKYIFCYNTNDADGKPLLINADDFKEVDKEILDKLVVNEEGKPVIEVSIEDSENAPIIISPKDDDGLGGDMYGSTSTN